MKRKLLSILLAGVMVSGLLAGCSSSGGSGGDSNEGAEGGSDGKPYEGVEINVLCEGHASSNAYEKMVSEFEEETGITVNLEIIPYEELPQKVLLSFSQKSQDYDMVMNDALSLQGYVDNDYIACLDDYIANDELNQWYDKADFVEAYENMMETDGKVYGFPVYGESTFLMYRKDLFDEYGLKAPTTMAELEECAKTVYEKTTGEVAGITLRGQQGIHVVYTWGAFLWGFGGHYFDQDGKLDLNTDEAIEGTETFCRLLNEYGPEGYTNFGWQENRLLFQQGGAAMTIDATVNGAYCEDPDESEIVGKVGYAPVPAAVDNEEGGPAALATHGFYINNVIEDKQKEAAFLFGSWATNAETQEKMMGVEPHCGVSSLKAIESDAFQDKYAAFGNDMVKALEVANPLYVPTNTEANEIINKVGTALSKCLVESDNIAAILKEVNDDVNNNVLK